MAYNYLTLTNGLLNRMNEVELTASNFANARGIQIRCKDAVNDALGHINGREFNWPFNYTVHTETLVAGTTRYTIPADAKHVDYDTFRIVKDATLGSDGVTLKKLDYKEYVDRYIDQEDDATVQGGIPTHVFRTPDNNYGLYTYPDEAYSLKYEYFANTTFLTDATDVPQVPEQFKHVILDGGLAYFHFYRGEQDLYDREWDRFQDGITNMQTQLINRDDYVRSYMITHPRFSNGFLRTS